MFVSKRYFILYTRDTFPAVENPKEESPKVFNGNTKSHFSNFQYERSPDKENIRQCFFTEKLRPVTS